MQKDYPSQRAYIAIEDGYISTSNIADEEDQDVDEEDSEVLGDKATTTYRSIIVQRVLSSQVQQPKKIDEASKDVNWVNAMHEELNNFTRKYRRTDQFIRIQVQWQSASGRTVILEPI